MGAPGTRQHTPIYKNSSGSTGMIENKQSLTSHGNSHGRSSLLNICEEALNNIHPRSLVTKYVERSEDTLFVEKKRYDLSVIDDIYIIGAGKGSAAVVGALRERIGGHFTDGIVIKKCNQKSSIPDVTVREAGHPIPNDDGRHATQEVLDIAGSASEDDLVFVCITGGASAQLVAPPADIQINDIAQLTKAMLRGGLPIDEINTVRKHVSKVKGGHLFEEILPASCASLVIIDEVAGEPWGPTVPDPTSYEDAIGVLKKRSLWTEAPRPIRNRLIAGQRDDAPETPFPGSFAGKPGQIVVLADATDLCDAAVSAVENRDFNSMVLSSVIEGESRTVGTVLASIAKEIHEHNRPIKKPCVVVSGGETTVTISNETGRGGPNQELALQFALDASELDDVVLLAIGTDGTDGPTDIAGGLVDGTSATRAQKRNIDIFERIVSHDSSLALEMLDDAVQTGPTGTNVMDLRLLLVL